MYTMFSAWVWGIIFWTIQNMERCLIWIKIFSVICMDLQRREVYIFSRGVLQFECHRKCSITALENNFLALCRWCWTNCLQNISSYTEAILSVSPSDGLFEFSPDGSRLASCSSNGYINVWNVYTNQVKQRFKRNPGGYEFLCWWSETFLFVTGWFNGTPKLTRYSVDDKLRNLFTHCQQVSPCHLVNWSEFPIFVDNFSEGIFRFICGRNKPVEVFDVTGVDYPVMIKLPGISGCNGNNCYMWKHYQKFATWWVSYFC